MVLGSAIRRTPAPVADGMDVQAMTVWLTTFGDAWEQGNADATATLFAPDATLQPSPFGELVRGPGRIAAHWAEVMSGQQAIRFQGEIPGVGATYGIAHWRVVIGQHDDRPRRVVDGILLAAFDRRGRAASVRSWSHEASGQSNLEPER
jgi:ketosteroid isomerase-like protein